MSRPVPRRLAAVLVSLLLAPALAVGQARAATVSSTELTSGWALRSATNVTDTGATISQPGYSTTGWYPITAPSTVLAGLVANNVYQNIYFSTNLQSVPDLTTQNWWYRGQFTAPATSAGQVYWLRFKGISYRAQIWLNGTQLDANAVGTMVAHEYNVTNLIHPGATITGAISKSPFTPITVSQTVTLNANERREISFTPAAYPALHVTNPALWWPYQFGTPELYQLATSATVGGATSDTKTINFGIRQFTDYRQTVNGTSFVGYKVNGVPIFFRGGGYVWDMLQRFDPKSDATTIKYVKDMGLNAIRFEGTLGNENLYDLADQNGIILMGGFVCCSAWENDTWTTEQENVAHASLDTQMRNLRAHPSAFLWAFGSDQPVSATHLAQYKTIATGLHWQNPTLDNVATWANANAGMKMDGPYVWEPPLLWWDTTKAGSAFGTTAEEGTESPPPLESLQKFLSPSDLWPIGAAWNYHAGKAKSVFDNIPGITTQSTTNATNLSIPANASTQVMTLPAVSGLSTTYFIRLQLKDSTGAVVSNNLYWYSTSPDTFGNKSNWYSTSVRSYANLTGLNSLATNSSVTRSASRTVASGTETVTITLNNTSATNIAFFLRPEVIAGSGGTEVLPITYTDNFVSLFPGESKTITASYATSDLGGQAPYLLVRGYNVPTTSQVIP